VLLNLRIPNFIRSTLRAGISCCLGGVLGIGGLLAFRGTVVRFVVRRTTARVVIIASKSKLLGLNRASN
jgi:hypothetical protein